MRAHPQQVRQLHELTDAAMATALSVALGNLRFLELPNGGSISLATIPLLVLALRRGARPALLAGLAAGLIHATYGGRIIHPAQFLLDYGIGSMSAALAATARGRNWLMPLGIVLASIVQFAAYVVSGVVFFSASTASPWIVSSIYNASVVVPETILALFMVPPVVRALDRIDPSKVRSAATAIATTHLPRQFSEPSQPIRQILETAQIPSTPQILGTTKTPGIPSIPAATHRPLAQRFPGAPQRPLSPRSSHRQPNASHEAHRDTRRLNTRPPAFASPRRTGS